MVTAYRGHGNHRVGRHVTRGRLVRGAVAGRAAAVVRRWRQRRYCYAAVRRGRGHTARPVEEREKPAAERPDAAGQATGHRRRRRLGQRHRQPVAADRRVATAVGQQLHGRHAPQPRRGCRRQIRSGQ